MNSSEQTGKICSQCDFEATYVFGHTRLCDIHYRIKQMRENSKSHGKYSPTRKELEDLIPEDMKCPECKVTMRWRRKLYEKGVNNQITIQHWRDGTIGLICLSCNARHASMPDDSYKDMPKDHKLCPRCQQILHENNFCVKNSRAVLKRNSICNSCNRELRKIHYDKNPEIEKAKSKKWREDNKEYMRMKDKEYKEKNKEKAKEQGKIWREKNKDHRKAYTAEYAKNNAEFIKQLAREWRKNNPEKMKLYQERAKQKRLQKKNETNQ
jgi:hypothetical protein